MLDEGDSAPHGGLVEVERERHRRSWGIPPQGYRIRLAPIYAVYVDKARYRARQDTERSIYPTLF